MHELAVKIKNRTAYNLSGLSFTPKEIALEIKKHIPSFEITYKPDFRQTIANSWPASIDDTTALTEWGWKAKYNLPLLVENMLKNLTHLVIK